MAIELNVTLANMLDGFHKREELGSDFSFSRHCGVACALVEAGLMEHEIDVDMEGVRIDGDRYLGGVALAHAVNLFDDNVNYPEEAFLLRLSEENWPQQIVLKAEDEVEEEVAED